MTPSLSRYLPDLGATEALGRSLARLLRPGDAVLLDGPLGAGKTALVRALLREACVRPDLEVPSPSYTLVQGYEATMPDGTVLPIAHLDLWRLDGPAAVEELGWDEARDGVVLVEWPDRLGPLEPPDALRVSLVAVAASADPDSDAPRLATLVGWPDRLPAGLGDR